MLIPSYIPMAIDYMIISYEKRVLSVDEKIEEKKNNGENFIFIDSDGDKTFEAWIYSYCKEKEYDFKYIEGKLKITF